VKTNKHASSLSPNLPPSFRFQSGRGRAKGGTWWRREIVWREIIILLLKQIFLLIFKIFVFVEIVFLLFVFQEKLVLQIKFILILLKVI